MNDSRAFFTGKLAAIACAIAVTLAAPIIAASPSVADSGGSGSVVAPAPAIPNYDPWV